MSAKRKRAESAAPAPAPTRLESYMQFARTHWRSPDGGKFEIRETGDEIQTWLYKHYWVPLTSFKLWPIDAEHTCSACRQRAGSFEQSYYAAQDTLSTEHAATGCRGLRAYPVQYVLIFLPRQRGKTVGTSGFVGATLFKGKGERIAFISGNEDKSKELYRDHYVNPIRENPDLLDAADIVGNVIYVEETDCRFEFFATSVASAVGGSFTTLIVDEARAVPNHVLTAMLGTTFARSGWECSTVPGGRLGHTRTTGDLDNPEFSKCACCASPLQPWTAKVLIMTSAGERTGGQFDWFFDLKDVLLEQPHPMFHVYASSEIGGKVSRQVVSATAEVLGRVESLKSLVSIETENIARARGEEFLSEQEIRAIVDRSLVNREYGERPGVAFLDTSSTVELTSLVLVEDDAAPEASAPWSRVVVQRIDIWNPKQGSGIIDERVLEEHLDKYVPAFKLLDLVVDDRACRWAQNFLARMRKKPWGRICRGAQFINRAERQAAWSLLEQRILGRTIRIPDNKTLIAELKAARRKYDIDGNLDVREEKRRIRHLDVAEGLASCCLLIHGQARPRGPGFAEIQRRSKELDAILRKAGGSSVAATASRVGGQNIGGGNWY